MPSFKDLTSAAGLKELNDYLASRSYIEGYESNCCILISKCHIPAVQLRYLW